MRHIRYDRLIVVVAMVWLVACGSTSAPGASASGGGVSAGGAGSGKGTVIIPASPVATALINGCPTQHIPVDPLPPAQVIVSQQGGGNGSPVALNVGQSMEIHLSSGMSWHLNLTDAAQILAATSVEGWYNSALHACVWRYSATKAGSATLDFIGMALCAPSQACPQYAIVVDYTVTVK